MNQQNLSRTWQALKELQFISSFFSWFFMLLSRLAEPCMLLSVLYIIIEAGVPQVTIPTLHSVAVGIMIAAPEIILPGAFVISRQAKDHGEKATPLYALCWLFVALTLVTLLSLFVLHLSSVAISVIMCLRCGAGVGYSIFVRMLSYRGVTTERERQVPAPQEQPQPPQLVICPELLDLLREMIAAQTTTIIAEVTEQRQLAAPVLKEEITIQPEQETQDSAQPGNFERVKAYLAQNPQAKVTEVAEALTIAMSTASKHVSKVRGGK